MTPHPMPSPSPEPRVCPRCRTVYPWAVWTCRRDGAALVARGALAMGSWVGDYRILDELGRGGCGRVYRAVPRGGREPVALKVLHAADDPELVARFRGEIAALVAVRHENVVSLVDHGVDAEGRDFLVMEHVRGHALAEELAERQPLDPLRAARITRELALALDAVHRAGFVHRDVKPSNVMIAMDGWVRLVDFGLARPAHLSFAHRLTEAGRLSGTPRYLAPEVYAGRAADARSDLYALGALLYELLTGDAPFDGTVAQVAAAHMTQAPAPLPRALGPLGLLARALLAKDPADRPASAREVAEHLDVITRVRARPAAPAIAAAYAA